MKRYVLAACLSLLAGLASAPAGAGWRASSPDDQALDAAAFGSLPSVITEQFADVQSVVVAQKGRVAFEFHRDGAPDQLRPVHSVAKSALAALVGIAIAQGRIASLDQPVVQLVPEWAPLNGDPRAAGITLRHLLMMSAGFEVNDPAGTAPALRPTDGWARPLRSPPGEKFAYDNSIVPMLTAVLEKATGQPLADFARRELVAPLGMHEPSYERGLGMRTADMARLGQLLLQDGRWGGRQVIPEAFARDATRAQNKGGPPVSMPYGYLWWVVPSQAARPTFMASGYGGQVIWVYPPLDLVVAITSAASPDSQRRGQAVQLLRGRLFNAARQRASIGP